MFLHSFYNLLMVNRKVNIFAFAILFPLYLLKVLHWASFGMSVFWNPSSEVQSSYGNLCSFVGALWHARFLAGLGCQREEFLRSEQGRHQWGAQGGNYPPKISACSPFALPPPLPKSKHTQNTVLKFPASLPSWRNSLVVGAFPGKRSWCRPWFGMLSIMDLLHFRKPPVVVGTYNTAGYGIAGTASWVRPRVFFSRWACG